MNLFQKYGIKEVADVVFYSIIEIEDEEFYIPVLYLDTLKVSTLEKSVQKITASGGYANKKLIGWNFGKEVSLKLEDALFTPASMSLIWGGDLQARLSPYMSAITKLNIGNKYGRLHYSTKAYVSPSLSEEEWNIIFKAAQEYKSEMGTFLNFTEKTTTYDTPRFWKELYKKNDPLIEQNRTELKKRYYKRDWLLSHKNELRTIIKSDAVDTKEPTIEQYEAQQAIPQCIINYLMTYITDFEKLGHIETKFHDIEVVDRMEKCVVKDIDGLKISTAEQKKNLLRYYQDDRSSSYVIYYDAKTMLPLFNITDEGLIKGIDFPNEADRDFDGEIDSDIFKLKAGTIYYKWSRTVKRKAGTDDGILGRTLVIDAESFPGKYKIVGETWIREQKTEQDQRYQFTINRATIGGNTNITLQADGEPVVFNMDIDVLTPPNGLMIELKEFDIDEDYVHGGTKIIPQRNTFTHTPTSVELIEDIDFTNDEIY